MYDNVDFELDMFALQEDLRVFRNVEDFQYRTDEWRNGKVRVLFLSGLSGSGKTTYGRRLAAETGATLRSLDGYLKKMLRAKYGQFDSTRYYELVYAHGVRVLLEDNPSGRLIIEGGQICWMNPDELKQHAVMIMGTSFTASTWRAILRDFSKEHWEEYGHIAPHVHTSFNLKTFSSLRSVMQRLQLTRTGDE